MSEASPLEPEAPVTGQARMDAAWGAHSGDETAADVAMASTAQSGQIFEQHYTPWRGTLNPRWMRNWSILRHHLLGIFKKGHRPWTMPTRIFILIAFLAVVRCRDDAPRRFGREFRNPLVVRRQPRQPVRSRPGLFPAKRALLSHCSRFARRGCHIRRQATRNIGPLLLTTDFKI